MYTLRTVSNHETRNQNLGETYFRVDRDYQTDNFRQIYKDTFGKEHMADMDSEADANSKGIVCFIIGKEVHPVYGDEFTYVVGPSGDTFECVNNPNKIRRKVG